MNRHEAVNNKTGVNHIFYANMSSQYLKGFMANPVKNPHLRFLPLTLRDYLNRFSKTNTNEIRNLLRNEV